MAARLVRSISEAGLAGLVLTTLGCSMTFYGLKEVKDEPKPRTAVAAAPAHGPAGPAPLVKKDAQARPAVQASAPATATPPPGAVVQAQKEPPPGVEPPPAGEQEPTADQASPSVADRR